MSTAAIIVAAGRGTRAGGDVAKQWQMLAGRRVLDWTVEAFRGVTGVNRIVLVLHPAELSRAAGYPGVLAVAGGETRAASVLAGLEALEGSSVPKVLIHDAARPLVSTRIIGDGTDVDGIADEPSHIHRFNDTARLRVCLLP